MIEKHCFWYVCPTRSLGISLNSEPCLRKTFPAVCWGLIPIPSSVIIADVAGVCLNSSAANFRTAVNGVFSGTLRTLNGNFGSDVSTILKVTLDVAGAAIILWITKYFTYSRIIISNWESKGYILTTCVNIMPTATRHPPYMHGTTHIVFFRVASFLCSLPAAV